jgi:hypothetical protein
MQDASSATAKIAYRHRFLFLRLVSLLSWRSFTDVADGSWLATPADVKLARLGPLSVWLVSLSSE